MTASSDFIVSFAEFKPNNNLLLLYIKESEEFIHIPSTNKRSSSWTLGWVPFQHMITLTKYADEELTDEILEIFEKKMDEIMPEVFSIVKCRKILKYS